MTNTLKALTGWTTVASLAILTACGGGGGGGGLPPPTGTNNTIVVTPSPTGVISVPVGQTQAFSATFTTSDGKTATNFTITSGLSTLPAGWTGPTSFTCASVSTGSGCVVNLTYKPTAAGSGSVPFNYSYVNNAGTSITGTATVSYASTSNNTVIATPAPAGPIAVAIGGQTTVGITFKTDDGATATELSAGLSGLPAGWSGPKSFTCASVSTGSGCVLNLTYKPSAIASGTLMLTYAYKDNSGTAKTGPISIAYSASAQNHVIATTTPAGQIVAVIGGTGQTVKVNFTTDDSNPASNLAVTPANLTSLPAGWTGPATFTCKTVSTGNGCELTLTYLATQTGSGSFTLNFGYTNNSGVASTGTVTITYVATVDNAVIGTPAPSGTVNVVVNGSKPVTVTFNSNGGSPATSLQITSGLGASLPAGWSGPSTFTCASVTTAGSSCQLSLTYAPTAYLASGTLQLNYGYKSNSGAANTGSVSIPYTATTHNTLVIGQSPSGTVSAVVNSAPVPVTLTITTDDLHPATAISFASGPTGLGGLPAGWTGPATFGCASASTGTGCQLALAYAPTANGSGTVSLPYSYDDNFGAAQNGTANISYASIPAALYITDTVSGVTRCTMSGVDGSLPSCASAGTGFAAPTAIAFSGKYAYVTPGVVATDVDVCPVNADGSLGTCVPATSAPTFGLPNALAVSGGYLYVSDAGGGGNVYGCAINADGSLSPCLTTYIGTVNATDGIAVTSANAFIVDNVGGNLTTCTNDGDGTFSACAQQTLDGSAPGGGNTPNSTPTSATVYGGNVYMGTHASILITPISVAVGGTLVSNYPCAYGSVSGTVTPCAIDDKGPVQTPVAGLVFNNGYAYASGYGSGGGIGICTVEASGIVDTCATSPSLPSGSGNYGGMAIH